MQDLNEREKEVLRAMKGSLESESGGPWGVFGPSFPHSDAHHTLCGKGLLTSKCVHEDHPTYGPCYGFVIRLTAKGEEVARSLGEPTGEFDWKDPSTQTPEPTKEEFQAALKLAQNFMARIIANGAVTGNLR